MIKRVVLAVALAGLALVAVSGPAAASDRPAGPACTPLCACIC